MKQPDENTLHAIMRKSQDADFKRIVAWIRGARDDQRATTEAVRGEERAESCGASAMMTEMLDYLTDAPAALTRIHAERSAAAQGDQNDV